jgi:hypothetical protein
VHLSASTDREDLPGSSPIVFDSVSQHEFMSFGVLTFLALGALAGVRVELVATRTIDPRIPATLALRLAEEGHVVVPPSSDAVAQVSVTATLGGALLTIRHADGVRESLRVEGDAASVLRLEVAQRSVVALVRDELGRPADEPIDRPGVAIEIEAVNPVAANRVGEALASSILSRGFALLPGRRSHGWTVCAHVEADNVDFMIGHPICDDRVRERIERAAEESPEIFQERWVAHALGLVHEDSPREARVAPIVPLDLSVSSSPERGDGPGFAFGASIGALARSGGADPLINLNARLAKRTGFFPEVALSAVPSNARGLTVFEIGLGVGPGAIVELSSELSAYGALLAGMSLHTFHLSGHDSGIRADWVLSVPIGLRWLASEGVALEGGVRLGLAGSAREHRIGDDLLWRRGALSGGFFVGIAYTFDR